MSEISSFLNDLHKNETLEEKREKARKRSQRWYNNMAEDPEKYREYMRKKRIKQWKKYHETLPSDEFWKRLARLYIREPDFAREVKANLNPC